MIKIKYTIKNHPKGIAASELAIALGVLIVATVGTLQVTHLVRRNQLYTEEKGAKIDLQNYIKSVVSCEKTLDAEKNNCNGSTFIDLKRADGTTLLVGSPSGTQLISGTFLRTTCVNQSGTYRLVMESQKANLASEVKTELWREVFKIPFVCDDPQAACQGTDGTITTGPSATKEFSKQTIQSLLGFDGQTFLAANWYDGQRFCRLQGYRDLSQMDTEQLTNCSSQRVGLWKKYSASYQYMCHTSFYLASRIVCSSKFRQGCGATCSTTFVVEGLPGFTNNYGSIISANSPNPVIFSYASRTCVKPDGSVLSNSYSTQVCADSALANQPNADRLCGLLGYGQASTWNAGSYSSPGDNAVFDFDTLTQKFKVVPAASVINSHFRSLTCINPDPAKCNSY